MPGVYGHREEPMRDKFEGHVMMSNLVFFLQQSTEGFLTLVNYLIKFALSQKREKKSPK